MNGCHAIATLKHVAGSANELQALRDRVEELEAILGLTGVGVEHLPLTRSQAAILGMLCRRDSCSRDSLFVALYGARTEVLQPEVGIIDVFLWRMRRLLGERGIVIQNRWGVGWWLKAEDKAKVRLWIAEHA
jgi:hypothetical protein